MDFYFYLFNYSLLFKEVESFKNISIVPLLYTTIAVAEYKNFKLAKRQSEEYKGEHKNFEDANQMKVYVLVVQVSRKN